MNENVVIPLGVPFMRALIRPWERQGLQPSMAPDVAARLEIEQAPDGVAIEVERTSEGHRFTTTLLSDRASDAVAPRRQRASEQ